MLQTRILNGCLLPKACHCFFRTIRPNFRTSFHTGIALQSGKKKGIKDETNINLSPSELNQVSIFYCQFKKTVSTIKLSILFENK